MTIKKIFPFFILIVASIAAMIFALAFLWSLDVDSPTLEKQVASTLQLGIPSGIALIVLVWFGAGIDGLLSRIQKKSTRLLTALGVYLVLPTTLCIVLPALLIILISSLMFPDNETNRGFGTGLFLTITAIPAIVGFFFIYIGAGVNALSRWLSGRIWRNTE
jgi:Na+-translocating ferredoxin:NAD+ oxidoreductase RnfA subunit